MVGKLKSLFDDKVVNVIYETDRYLRFSYLDRHLMPYGEVQGRPLDHVYQDQTKITSIKTEIDEVKELCTYLNQS